jgi:hypothetical protein
LKNANILEVNDNIVQNPELLISKVNFIDYNSIFI